MLIQITPFLVQVTPYIYDSFFIIAMGCDKAALQLTMSQYKADNNR